MDDFQDYIEEKAVFEGTGQTATKRIFRFSGRPASSTITTTGKLMESRQISRRSNDEFKQIQLDRNYTAKSDELSDEMMVAIARSMAEKIANKLVDVIFPAKILIKRDTIVTINRGEGGGMARGRRVQRVRRNQGDEAEGPGHG